MGRQETYSIRTTKQRSLLRPTSSSIYSTIQFRKRTSSTSSISLRSSKLPFLPTTSSHWYLHKFKNLLNCRNLPINERILLDRRHVKIPLSRSILPKLPLLVPSRRHISRTIL